MNPAVPFLMGVRLENRKVSPMQRCNLSLDGPAGTCLRAGDGLTRREFCILGSGTALGVLLVPRATEAAITALAVEDDVRIRPVPKGKKSMLSLSNRESTTRATIRSGNSI